MIFVFNIYLWIISLLFVGQCNSIQTFCDYCECDIPDIWCSYGINIVEAFNNTIPRNAKNATSLDINYFYGKLEIGNDTLNDFPALKRFTINTGEVAFVSDNVFEGLRELSYIYLGLNNIHEIPVKALSYLKDSLQELHLVNQRLVSIQDNSFEKLGSLRKLTIAYNRNSLAISAGVFTGLTNLTDLDLTSCGIQRLFDTTFMGLQNLHSLDLSYNSLVEVPIAIQAIESLLKLDLSYNRVLRDPKDLRFLRGTSRLQELQARFCAISEISSEAVDHLNATQDLSIANFDGNPFNCTKDICSFASWYTSRPKPSSTTQSPFFIPFITLSPPPGKGPYQCDNNGQLLDEFYFESCLPSPNPVTPSNTPDKEAPSWHVVIISVAVILVAFVVILVSFVVWKFRLPYYYHQRFGMRFHQHAAYGAMAGNAREYSFDAYVSHHEDDKPFVEDEMLPRLEDEHDFELCVSFRNFRLGSNLLENVSSAQDVSRAIIFVINDRFMQNGQCKLELEMASTRMLEDERDQGGQRLILILMDVIAPDLVNNTLRMLLNHVAYLEWDPTAEDRCWGQLIATLRTLVPERNDDHADNDEFFDEERNDHIAPFDNEHDNGHIA